MADKGISLKRIFKVFAIVAVMIAMGLCALLVGCGKPRDEGNNGDDGIGNNDCGIVSLPTHFISSIFESEYDVENFVIPMSYACSNKFYPCYNYKDDDDDYYSIADYQICFFANKDRTKDTNYSYKTFNEMQPGEIFDNIYMIEKLTIPNKEDGLVDMDALRNTLEAYYFHYDLDSEYWIYDHNLTVDLPREYLDDNGTLYFDIRFLFRFVKEPEGWNLSNDEKAVYTGETRNPPHFDYSIEGDKVKLTNIDNGAHKIRPYDSVYSTNYETLKIKGKSAGREFAETDRDDFVEESEADFEQSSQMTSALISYGVHGNIFWVDRSGKSHPANQVQVEAFDKVTKKALGNAYTNKDGYYSIDFTTSNTEDDNVYIKLTLDSGYARAVNYSKKTYSFIPANEEHTRIATRTVIDTVVDMNTEEGQALQVYQAVVYAAMYAEQMSGETLSSVRVVYPNSNPKEQKCYYDCSDKTMYIISTSATNDKLKSYESWDVIMHEYGHHVQWVLEKDCIGGSHVLTLNMADHFYEDSIANECTYEGEGDKDDYIYKTKDVKDYAIRLSWSEGWATYFALTAQMFFKSELKNITTCCNQKHEVYGAEYPIDEERCEYNMRTLYDLGEGCESVTTAFLWDLFDDEENTGVKESFDKINLSSKELWDIMFGSHAKTLSGFKKALIESNKVNINDLAKLFGRYRLSAGGLNVSSNVGPKRFTWSARGGSKHYPNNQFDFKLYNASTDKILVSRTNVRDTSVTLYEAEWRYLIDLDCDFYWVVESYQNDDVYGGNCVTGPYRSEEVFVPHSKIGNGRSLAYNTLTSGSVDDTNNEFYFYTSSGYQYNIITVTSNISLRLDLYHSGDPLEKDGCVVKTGKNISFMEEFSSGGTTIYIKISSHDGSAGTFNIIIEPHTHSFSGYELYDDNQHARVCSCGAKIHENHIKRLVCIDETQHGYICTCGYSWTSSAHVWRKTGNDRICRVCGYLDMQLPGMSITTLGDEIMSHCSDCA